MSTLAAHESLVSALRAALDRGGVANRPGQLKPLLEEALGPHESARLRPVVHQVLAAAEENLPANLSRITPLTVQSLRQLSGELATSRGWRPEVAARTTGIWASAFGFDDLAAAAWPADRDEALSPVAQEAGSGRPAPAHPPRLDPAVTAPPPSPVVSEESRPTDGESWPRSHKRLAPHHPESTSGEQVLAVVPGYAGMSLPLFAALVVALLVVLTAPILLFDVTGGLVLPLVGIGGAVLLRRRLVPGALTAAPTTLEFVPYRGNLAAPKPAEAFSATWPEVEVLQGTWATSFTVAGRRVQVGPRHREFAAAAARQAREAR